MPHVDLLVDDELLDQLPTAAALLNGTEVGRRAAGNHQALATLNLAYVPLGAATIDPVFERNSEGLRVQSIQWGFPDADPDDPPVMCWHTESPSPCDWNVCRQPDRLLAGDAGTDFGARER